MPGPADPLLTLDQAADALGTGPDFITHLVAIGQLDHTDAKGEPRIPQSALIAYAITAGDSSQAAEALIAPELHATTQVHDPHAFHGQEVAA